MVGKGQGRNNRSQGQRIRRTRENIAELAAGQEQLTEVVSQHDRDIRMIKARLADLEVRDRDRDRT